MTMMMGGLMQGMIKQGNNEDVNGTPQKKLCSGDGKNCNALIPHSPAWHIDVATHFTLML